MILDGVGSIPVGSMGTVVREHVPKFGVRPREGIVHPGSSKDERIGPRWEQRGVEEQTAIVGMGGKGGNKSPNVTEAEGVAERITGTRVEPSGRVERIHPIGWLPEYTTVEGYGTVFPVEQRMVHDDAQAVG
jgi:hypothetical protein